MKISIAVPTYECFGDGWLYISELLNSIRKQTYKNVEIVISDQSTDDKTKKLVEFYKQELDIKYLNSSNIPRKISFNLNNAIKNCSGDVIKTMMADDFFINNLSLEKIVKYFKNNDINWLITGCVHCESIHYMNNQMIPYYHDKIHLGANTISSPSVLSMRHKNYFDENLSLLTDCEMYKRLYTLYGPPAILPEPFVCNRMHKNQMQKLDSTLKEKEQEYCIKLYGT